jgi:ferredoxin-NADP reductase
MKVTDIPAPPSRWLAATVRHIQHWPGYGVRLRFDVPRRPPHLPGQHYVVRLVAPDGYSAQRSYSLASDLELVDGIGAAFRPRRGIARPR